ncbi:phosphotransferase system HPr (HPr) family protein [Arcanobacterium wilhelmae]|uniref:Phosphocarrier protein HPr n=1 Tax=Arcanobacterium wilhelmae TaxID=1803177 RepID=A0ABT9ND64_9ACTO|nr:HPr family phosphocarrier protein [Arcanobacterium wilhelmae]MDP9801656.1 phosphotransferase system HPr (HPr) family protein [Arcanobacterium wilhelmae]WFN90977.1 HPr family phosphocarrier protein [Arcanobacterium wilhelmae]
MAQRVVTVGSKVGLHARPAAKVAEVAEETGADILLTFGEEEADAASILEIMALGAMNGDEITVSGDDETAVNTVADLIASDLDGEE